MKRLVLVLLVIFAISCDSGVEKLREIGELVKENENVEKPHPQKKEISKKEKKDAYTEKIITKNKSVSFKTITKKDNGIKKGSKKVLVSGKNGIREVRIKIKYKNGKEIGRKTISSKLIRKPIDKVVAVGTRPKKEKPDKWVNITGWGNSGKYFKTMRQANNWAEQYILSDANTNSENPKFAFTVIQTAWKNQRTGEIEERGFIVIFR